MNSASKVDREFQEWLPQATDQLRRRKEKWRPPVLPFLQKFPTDPCCSGTQPKSNQQISLMDGPHTFQTAASLLGLGASESVHELFNSRAQFSTVLH